jgi:hypothetical protein
LVSFVSGATPTQLRDLFLEHFLEGEGQSGARSGAIRHVRKDLVELCQGVMRDWQPPSCPADQVVALLEIIEWFPETFDRCAPLVFANGDEEAARKLLTMHPLADLEALPRHLWPCVHWSACTEAQLLTLVEAGVPVPLDQIPLEKLGWETQQVLIDAQAEQVGACAEYAAKMIGPITSYLTRFFELLPNSTPMLLKIGDGLEEEERKVSGWNKMVHALLVSLRERIREGNVLHTEEQLIVFRGCSRRDVDSANSALLADLLEAKNVDPSHVASLVKFVLGERRFHQTVRDSAPLPEDQHACAHHGARCIPFPTGARLGAAGDDAARPAGPRRAAPQLALQQRQRHRVAPAGALLTVRDHLGSGCAPARLGTAGALEPQAVGCPAHAHRRRESHGG